MHTYIFLNMSLLHLSLFHKRNNSYQSHVLFVNISVKTEQDKSDLI